MEEFFVRISPDMIAIIIIIFIVYLLRSERMVGRRQARALSFIALLMMVIILLEVITVYFEEYPSSRFLMIYRISNAIGFSLTPTIGILFAFIYVAKVRQYLIPIMVPIIILVVLSILSIWTGWIFSINSSGYYHRGPFYIVNIVINIYSLLVYAYALRVKGRAYDKVEQINLMSQFAIVLSGGLIQVVFPKILILWPCFSLVLLLYIDFLKALLYKYDSLTDVRNRRCFDENFEDAREFEDLYIVIFDINNLKSINDQYGHAQGDEYIKTVVDIMKKFTVEIGVLYRIGGDEFCCLCKYVPQKRLEQVLKKVEDEARKVCLYTERGQLTGDTIAYGYAYYSKSLGHDLNERFKLADKAMYIRKNHQKQL